MSSARTEQTKRENLPKRDPKPTGAPDTCIESDSEMHSVFSSRNPAPAELRELTISGSWDKKNEPTVISHQASACEALDEKVDLSVHPTIERMRNFLDKPTSKIIALNMGSLVAVSFGVSQWMQNQGIHNTVTDHLGNFGWALFGVPIVSSVVRHLPSIGKYSGEIVCASVCVWSTLGETVAPQIFPGSPDIFDVPAALTGAILGYIFARDGLSALKDSLASIMWPDEYDN